MSLSFASHYAMNKYIILIMYSANYRRSSGPHIEKVVTASCTYNQGIYKEVCGKTDHMKRLQCS